MDKGSLLGIIKRFSDRKILVVGDLMIDHFIWGNVERISPEAPVPVVQIEKEEMRPGGAANVALNLAGLGAEVHIAGLVGDDAASESLRSMLDAHGLHSDFLVREKERVTTIKTRVIAHNQQVVRFDRETRQSADSGTTRAILERLHGGKERFDAVIVSDYGKGVVGRRMMDGLRDLAQKRRIPVSVDPKLRNIPFYKHIDLITPNHHEAGEMLGIRLVNENAAVEAAGKRIVKKLDLKCLLITRAGLGMSIFLPGAAPLHIPTVARQVFDVTGAGDCVIAVATLARSAGAKWDEAAVLANQAAGIVVGKIGTATVTAKELKDALKKFP